MTKPEKRIKILEKKVDRKRKRLAKAQVRLDEAKQLVREKVGPAV